MPAKHNSLIKLFWAFHLKLYLWSSGRIGNMIRGLPVLLLTTKGKKTGQLRTKALMYLPYGNAFVVIASNLGKDNHPAWWLNLQADSAATVQIKDSRFSVHAREAEGDEREKIFNALAEKTPDYEQYRAWTSRRIPLVILERR
ncbi:MAG: nitroreductase family deazaflavin-dependent oxidoreductase [Anaerolineales bacterium]